ncbi:MAG: hypothetical protein M3Z08_00750 [Chloroflexota bacterium]|nr:hypothetical protein [Chloroflexota bacterium]
MEDSVDDSLSPPLATPISSTRSRAIRLGIAFVLGLQLGIFFSFFNAIAFPQWVQRLPVGVLIVAMMLSILFDPRVQQGTLSSGRLVIGIVKILLAIGIPLIVLTALFFLVPASAAIGVFLIPLAVALVVAFTVGGENVWLACLSGLLGWLGVGLPAVLASYMQSREPGSDFGGLAFVITLVGVAIGLVIAVLGGFLGRLLRRWSFGEA